MGFWRREGGGLLVASSAFFPHSLHVAGQGEETEKGQPRPRLHLQGAQARSQPLILDPQHSPHTPAHGPAVGPKASGFTMPTVCPWESLPEAGGPCGPRLTPPGEQSAFLNQAKWSGNFKTVLRSLSGLWEETGAHTKTRLGRPGTGEGRAELLTTFKPAGRALLGNYFTNIFRVLTVCCNQQGLSS